MISTSIAVTDQVMRDGMQNALDAFASAEGTQVAEAAAQLVEAGRIEAYYVPAVRFILDSTLSVINSPEVRRQHGREVGDRQNGASYIAMAIAKRATDFDLFCRIYEATPVLADLIISSREVEALQDEEYLGSLGGAPFFDARIVSGGALRVARAKGFAHPTEVVKDSTGLLAIASLPKDAQTTRMAHEMLGLPYVRAENLTVEQEDGKPRIAFAPEALALIKRLHRKGGGCPAGKLQLPAGETTIPLIQKYWRPMVDFLLPKNARVSNVT